MNTEYWVGDEERKKFINKDETPTRHGFACGYIYQGKEGTRVSMKDHVYYVQNNLLLEGETFRTKKEAMKEFKIMERKAKKLNKG